MAEFQIPRFGFLAIIRMLEKPYSPCQYQENICAMYWS